MGDSAHAGFAVFCHTDLNTQKFYALIQSGGTSSYTYLNCRNGGQIVFRQKNTGRMRLKDEGSYDMLDLYSLPTGGSSKLWMRQGNGNYLDIEASTSQMRFRYENSTKLTLCSSGNMQATRIDLTGILVCQDV